MSEVQLLKKLILDGIELTYGKLSLCDLTHYSRFRGTRRWQIFCNDKRATDFESRQKEQGFYKVYHDLDDALQKFFEIKLKISNRVR
jgi:competence protein ComGF